MAELPKISDAEWDVMRVVLKPKVAWSERTIKTMLGRLVSKGALSFEQDGIRYLYRAKVRRDVYLKHASKLFLERIFAGDPGSMGVSS